MSGNAGARWTVPGDVRGSRRHVRDRRARLGPLGWTGLVIGMGAVVLFLSVRLLMVADVPWLGLSKATAPVGPAVATGDGGDERFVSFVFDDVQATWSGVFAGHDLVYRGANLVLYRGSVASPCGSAPAAPGPFYCLGDGNVYVDLAAYDEQRARDGAAVELGESYAIAREVGYHVQNLIGTLGQTTIGLTVPPAEATRSSVALELQAACFAGVWAASADARGVLAPTGDAGPLAGEPWSTDDGQPASTAVPILATAEQRWAWFLTGFDTGDPAACDTLASP